MDAGCGYDEAHGPEFSAAESRQIEFFEALLSTMPTTRAGALASVRHVVDCGNSCIPEAQWRWLEMLLKSPLVPFGVSPITARRRETGEKYGQDQAKAKANRRFGFSRLREDRVRPGRAGFSRHQRAEGGKADLSRIRKP